MSGLIKQFVGTLGVLMVMAGHGHAQNTPAQPVQNESVGAVSAPTQTAAEPSANIAAPVVTTTNENANSVNNTQNTPTPNAATTTQSQENAQPTAAGNLTSGGVANQNNVGENSSVSPSNAQALPPINNQPGNGGVQDTNARQVTNPSTGNSVAQPLPPINTDTNNSSVGNSVEPAQASNLSVAPLPETTSPAGVDASTLPHDLSPYGMFMQADWVVKSVMIGLAAASLLTWIIFVAKTLELGIAKARMRSAVRVIVSAHNLAEVIEKFSAKKNVSGRLVNAAANEVRMSINAVDEAGTGGIKERVTSALSRIEAHAGRRMAGGSAILATIGSISPFVGLFGTVWGIMNAFIGISKSQVTNLAVVAPGIAEALLATAIGLVAAIPAVVIYNYLAKSIVGYRQIVTDASTGIERLVSRDLDFREAQKKSPRVIQPLAAE